MTERLVMEILDLKAIPVEADVKPLEEHNGITPYVTCTGEVSTAKRVLVRLETEGDVTGWGEIMMDLSPSTTVSVLEEDVAPKVIGRNVWEIEAVRESFIYTYVDIMALFGAVEMAMWDALGKHLGAPLHQLLGGKCMNEVPVAYCVGILDPESSREHAQRALDGGYDVLKTKAGQDWKQDVERILAMDDEAGGELEFRIDPNQAWSFGEAVRVGALLEDAGVYLQYLEQPIRIETFGTYKRLRQRLRQPICVNDDTYFPHNLFNMIREDAIDVGVIDAAPSGILGVKRMAGVASDAGVSLAHHCGFDLGIKTAAMLHTVASTPTIDLPSDTIYYALADHIVESPFSVKAGSIRVPDAPGLGVSVDEERVEDIRIR